MNKLKTVRIGPIFFDIARVEKLLDDDGATKLDGDINYNLSRIQIEAVVGPQKAKQVLWHEIIHGLLRQSGVHVENCEVVCDVLSHGIMQVLMDNELIDTDMEV
jgi:hypothetical protein